LFLVAFGFRLALSYVSFPTSLASCKRIFEELRLLPRPYVLPIISPDTELGSIDGHLMVPRAKVEVAEKQ
jgi:hypothetical protein